MKEITKAQEQILYILWDLKKGVVNDILERIPDPKPAYNTVSTVVRVLEKKGYVDHKAYGKTYVYYPVIQKEEYARNQFKDYLKTHFGNSIKQVVSFFARENELGIEELEDLKQFVEKEINKQKGS